MYAYGLYICTLSVHEIQNEANIIEISFSHDYAFVGWKSAIEFYVYLLSIFFIPERFIILVEETFMFYYIETTWFWCQIAKLFWSSTYISSQSYTDSNFMMKTYQMTRFNEAGFDSYSQPNLISPVSFTVYWTGWTVTTGGSVEGNQ